MLIIKNVNIVFELLYTSIKVVIFIIIMNNFSKKYNEVLRFEISKETKGILRIKQSELSRPSNSSLEYKGKFIIETDYVLNNFSEEELEFYAYGSIMKTYDFTKPLDTSTVILSTEGSKKPFKEEMIVEPLNFVISFFELKWNLFTRLIVIYFDSDLEEKLMEKYQPIFKSRYKNGNSD